MNRDKRGVLQRDTKPDFHKVSSETDQRIKATTNKESQRKVS